MGISLITGETGIEHVRSFHDAALYASIAGEGEYALDELGAPTASLTSSNKVHVNAGNLLMQGHHIYIDSAGVDVNITTGSQGKKRNILIVATYEMDDDGIESVKLEAVYGTETTGTPADPAITHGDIVTTGARALKNQMPLFRVAQHGITPSEPVAVFENLKSYSKYWDSVSRDYIVDIGTTSVWRWEKWASGKAVCRAEKSGYFEHYSDSVGGMYGYAFGEMDYPFEFSSIPHVEVSARIGSGVSFGCNMANYNTSDVRMRANPYAVSTQWGPAYCYFTVRAEGMLA